MYYSFDAAGNPLSDKTTAFVWNTANTLYSTVKSAETHTYKYNALDQYISKNGPLSPQFLFFYDPHPEYRNNALQPRLPMTGFRQ